MKAITLINPAGIEKEFTNVEFYALKIEFSKAAFYLKWAAKNNRVCWIKSKKGVLFSTFAIDDFLFDSKYKVIHNNK